MRQVCNFSPPVAPSAPLTLPGASGSPACESCRIPPVAAALVQTNTRSASPGPPSPAGCAQNPSERTCPSSPSDVRPNLPESTAIPPVPRRAQPSSSASSSKNQRHPHAPTPAPAGTAQTPAAPPGTRKPPAQTAPSS
uniref:(northern house mosquito) hypothetical protein n=1 Tax=Culex pipiens TaxID=7175 RepID=A0A8D8CEB3_CULPI